MKQFLKLSFVITLLMSAAFILNSCKKDFDSPPGPADPNITANTTIAALKALHTTGGAYDLITSDLIISGVVVANDKSGNLYKQLFIQDSTGGLQVLLDASGLYGTYPVGRKVFIRCKGLTITDYNRTMELGVKAMVNGLPSMEAIPGSLISQYIVAGSINNPVVPTVVNLNDLTTNMQDKYIGTLIQLDGYAFATPNRTYSDTSAYKSTTNLDIKNCANQVTIVRTSAYSNFAGRQVAQGRGSILAIYTIFNTTKQFIIRDTSDVRFTEPYACALPPGTLLLEDFESIGANNLTLSIPGWQNIGETGGVLYQNAVFGPVKCAKISSFSTGKPSVTSWLISPVVNLTGATAPKLTFMNAAGYGVGATSFKVLISTNYTGSTTPSTATWTELPANFITPPATGYSAFVSSGIINLSAYIGQNVHIAFKYQGGDPTATTTWEIDDVKVTSL
ncbi:MAG TPA: DUF5689 domain-containing protein [Ferruginibacter sp.]|nr:DUF5689 domain-containing protein [Ferruginibacter sp.]